MRPAAGAMKPSSALIIVLLPAPFGPSRPTAPSGKAALTSASALFFPYSTVRFSSVTAAWGRAAGPVCGESSFRRGRDGRLIGGNAHGWLLANTGRARRWFASGHSGHRVPFRPSGSAASRSAAMTWPMCSSSGRPSSSAPALQVLARNGAGKGLVLHPLLHRARPRGRARSCDGRTSAAATMNPDSSSQAKSVCSSRDSRGTPVWSAVREDRTDHRPPGYPFGAEDLGAPEGMVLEARKALVVEVMEQRGVAPERPRPRRTGARSRAPRPRRRGRASAGCRRWCSW